VGELIVDWARCSWYDRSFGKGEEKGIIVSESVANVTHVVVVIMGGRRKGSFCGLYVSLT